MDIRDFDPITYLDDRGIDYRTEGPDISKGWIGLNCPFCPDGDHAFHLGINLSQKSISCWRCGKRGIAIHLIMDIESCSYGRAWEIAENYIDPTIQYEERRRITRNESIQRVIPNEASKEIPQLHREFLAHRNFDPDFIIRKYDLFSCYQFGDYKYRLIIPISHKKEIVSFVARDVTGKGYPPYLNCSDEKSIIPPKYCLYNLDSVKDSCLVVEGILDSWRIGDGCVATFGTKFTKEQIRLLVGMQRVFTLFDAETAASEQALKFCSEIACVVPEVKKINLSVGDPADLDHNEVREIRRLVFARKFFT